ncbi:DNA/RNA helicase domain-containing protein [Sandarakinorhabdus glacialis]|nr:DNA/RNA helicase domain-containing protein [Polymorphobacter glacialis]
MAILGALTNALPFAAEIAQRGAWKVEIDHLQLIGAQLPTAEIFLEFAIPRMGRRADAIIVAGGLVFVLEYKVGERSFPRHAIEQVHGYALDLKNFHVTSHDKAIVPLLISTEAPPQQLGLGFWADDRVHEPIRLGVGDVLPTIQRMIAVGGAAPFDAAEWASGGYRPTPNIIEAAEALYRGHAVTEISRSEAGAENLTRTAAAIEAVVDRMKANGGKAICFVTGVPGAGKTLAGLNIACGRMAKDVGEDATFLSGNGPLVDVLREALKRDVRARKGRPVAGDGDARHLAERSPDKFVQNVHHFRDEYLLGAIPSEHVVVFDEAQRAWDRKQTAEFMRKKRGQAGFDMSEPAFLLSVMDRHPDWCVVVCLIGEGQEINRGEAGVSEWVRALQGDLRHWEVHLPPHLLEEGSLDAGLRWHLSQRVPNPEPELHLAVSIRSFRAETVSAYVAAVLGENSSAALATLPRPSDFPVLRTRNLATARARLRAKRRAGERAGLLASSNALRLKPEGLYVKAEVDVCNWFLNPVEDVRSSDALEDAATEFDVQGLELDWTCVAWDLNLRRIDKWEARAFRGTRWTAIHGDSDELGRADYVRNAYRVLLTRARQGMIIFVPPGDAEDATRPPAEYDAIYNWLGDCGATELT